MLPATTACGKEVRHLPGSAGRAPDRAANTSPAGQLQTFERLADAPLDLIESQYQIRRVTIQRAYGVPGGLRPSQVGR
jgi:hypothetical protein